MDYFIIKRNTFSLRDIYIVNTEGTHIGNRGGRELQRGLSWFNAKTYSSILPYHFVKILVSLETMV